MSKNYRILKKIHCKYLVYGSKIRCLILIFLGLKIGKNVIIGRNTKFPIFNLKNIKIGDNVQIGSGGWFFLPTDNKNCEIGIGEGAHIGDRFTISCNNKINIGENCLLSYNVSILDHDHIFGNNLHPTTSGITKGEPIKIGNDCFIGCNVTILKGVSLGVHCIVGANSVVTKPFPDNSIIVGVPAAIINKQDH